MRVTTLIGLVAGLASQAVDAACPTALQIDNFAQWGSNKNSLGQWTSDDKSMRTVQASGNILTFRPKASPPSYFYETLGCQKASSSGHNSVIFTIKAPKDATATLEMQHKTNCDAGTYSQSFVALGPFTGATQTITIPFTQFSGANANAITGLVWSTFSSTTASWQISNIRFGCGSTAPSPTPSAIASGKVSVDGSCGGTNGYTCKGSTFGDCCSSYGWCGSSNAHCDSGCQSTFGVCPGGGSGNTNPSATSMVTQPSPAPGTCSPLVIDDWISQSRLTFMFYNAFNYPTSTDDSVQSITVGKPSRNHVQIVPSANGPNYFYSQFPCVNAKNKYGGISLRIKAPRGAAISVQLDSSDSCDPNNKKSFTQSSTELGWTFDGTEKLYYIPFTKYAGLNTEKLTTILFSGFSTTFEFGPMAFYCGSSGEYVAPAAPADQGPSGTVAAPKSSATNLVIDRFANAGSNALGFWHGGDEGMTLNYNGGKLQITAPDADYSFYTQVSGGCSDFSRFKGSYLHIAYSGTTKFTVAFQQHNQGCKAEVAPYPETWDSAEASRYARNGHIYIPINHFNIDLTRVIGFALKGFHTQESVTLSVIEIVNEVPSGYTIPVKDKTGNLVFACKRPNSFAFAIDDGIPSFAQDVLKIIREENIKVTFFTVGAPLLDQSTNLTNVYKEMQAAGHQLALHSFTHPKMESLDMYADIDWEYNEDVKAMKSQFNGLTTPYFRPPFGNEGARMRSRLVKAVGDNAHIVNWSVDVEDWLWASTNTPEKQMDAFKRDVNKGGNLVVLHYLYPSTVSYLREFIKIAKATGKQLMRVDQCMMDPNAPPL